MRESGIRRTARLAMPLLALVTIAGCTAQPSAIPPTRTPAPTNTPTPRPAYIATVMAGAGEGTATYNSFLPQLVTVRVGDTVSWKNTTEEPHTVTLTGGTISGGSPVPDFAVPLTGGQAGELMLNPQLANPTRAPNAPVESYSGSSYVNSGLMTRRPLSAGAPANDTFSVKMTKAGQYSYVCVLHPTMRGIVNVVPIVTLSIPDQVELDAHAGWELAPLKKMLQAAKDQAKTTRSDPVPGGTTLYQVRAGVTGVDPAATSFEFYPKDLTVKTGDTVVWTSPDFPTVTFDPAPPAPEPFIAKPQPSSPPLLALNPEVFVPAKTGATYDPAKAFNSGDIGAAAANGLTWSLAFDKPDTHKYICAVHTAVGMVGTITVVAR